eukprot:PITA_10535
MKDLGRMHYLLGLEVWQQKGEIFLGQGRYAIEIPKRFGMGDCRPMATPMITNWKKIDASEDKDVDPTLYRQLIGSLMYLVNTRPDICYAINTLSHFMVELKRAHWAATRHILKYLQGTIDYRLLYTKGKDIRLSGFTDVDWTGSSVDRKSTSGYCFNIGLGMTSWCSRKQKSVALSSSELEYKAANTTSCEAIWLRKLLVYLFRRNMEVTKIMCDNQSWIKLSENPVFHDRSKHIDIRCHFWYGEQLGGNKYGTEKWEISVEAKKADAGLEGATQRQQRLCRGSRACIIHTEAVGVMQKARKAAQSLNRLTQRVSGHTEVSRVDAGFKRSVEEFVYLWVSQFDTLLY